MPDEPPVLSPPEAPPGAPDGEAPEGHAPDGASRSSEGTRVRDAAYQACMQSTARVVEETSEQLRQLASLSTAASGVALRLMLEGEQPEKAARAMAHAQQSLREATDLFQRIGRVSIQLLERFQPPASPPPASTSALPSGDEPDETP